MGLEWPIYFITNYAKGQRMQWFGHTVEGKKRMSLGRKSNTNLQEEDPGGRGTGQRNDGYEWSAPRSSGETRSEKSILPDRDYWRSATVAAETHADSCKEYTK